MNNSSDEEDDDEVLTEENFRSGKLVRVMRGPDGGVVRDEHGKPIPHPIQPFDDQISDLYLDNQEQIGTILHMPLYDADGVLHYSWKVLACKPHIGYAGWIGYELQIKKA